MMDTFRDTFAGQLIYIASGRRLLRYQEERPEFKLPERYQPGEKTERERELREKRERLASIPNAPGYPHVDRSDSDSERTRIAENGADGEKKEEDKNLVDWYGEDDPENPLNWSTTKKCFVTACLCVLTTTMYTGSSIYSPGTMGAVADLHVAQVPASLGLSLFVVGYGVGPLFLSPLTEIPAVGRTIPYIITLALFCILQVPTALVNNYAGFLVLRFLAGFVSSPPLATGGASIADMFTPEWRPFAMGAWGCSAAAGPAIGPVISGFAIQNNGWRWFAWILLFWSGGSLLILIFTLPETSSLNILVRRARRLRKLTGNDKLTSQGEIDQANMTPKDIATMTLLRPFQMTLTEPVVIAANLYIGFIYAVLYAWFEVLPLTYTETYGWSLGISQLPFLALLIGAFLGYAGYCVWNRVYFVKVYRQSDGNPAPEQRLPPAFVGAFMYPICLFGYAWTSGRTTPWLPIFFSGFFGVGTTLMFNSVLNYLPDIYPQYAASVLASNDFFRSLMGAGSPMWAHGLFANLGVDWGTSLLGFLSLLFIPLPFLLFHGGPRLRKASKMAKSD